MKRAMMKYVGLVIVVLGATGLGLAQTPALIYSECPEATAPVAAGSVLEYDATASLTTTGLTEADPGAQGWSLSIAAENGKIVSARPRGPSSTRCSTVDSTRRKRRAVPGTKVL